MSRARAFTPEEFHERLQRDDLTPPLTVTGITRKSATEDPAGKLFAFSVSGCEGWVDVPVDAVASAELIGTYRCNDHSHPLVSLEFKSPRKGVDSWTFSLLEKMSAVARYTTIANEQFKLPEGEEASPCSNCIKRCRDLHPGDFFAFIDCAAGCC